LAEYEETKEEEEGMAKVASRLIVVVALLAITSGCASKLVLIKSEPSGAHVQVNGSYTGKTPVSYRFEDNFQFAIHGTDHYTVDAEMEGYESDTRVFRDGKDASADYVPDVIFFRLKQKE